MSELHVTKKRTLSLTDILLSARHWLVGLYGQRANVWHSLATYLRALTAVKVV